MRVFFCVLVACQCACGQPYQNLPFKPDPALWALTCGDLAVDWQDATCHDLAWQVPACAAPVLREADDLGHDVAPLPTPLTYTESPPLSGSHRADWAFAGEYAFLPPQRWLTNLQHGDLVVLYHPCVPASLVSDLRDFLRSLPGDAAGPVRWVLTPYPGLDTAFAIATWRHSFAANCLDRDAATAFVQAHYRHAPEDLDPLGSYTYAWIGRNAAVLAQPNVPPPPCSDAGATDGP
jgi:hypothetical protein